MNSVLIISFGKLPINQAGLFCCKRQSEEFIKFYIILNERFRQNFDIKIYPILKKYYIVHEFCHFISVVINVDSKLAESESLFFTTITKIVLFSEIYDILREYKEADPFHDVIPTIHEEMDNFHFKFNNDDNIDYNLLYRNLLLSSETINEFVIPE